MFQNVFRNYWSIQIKHKIISIAKNENIDITDLRQTIGTLQCISYLYKGVQINEKHVCQCTGIPSKFEIL